MLNQKLILASQSPRRAEILRAVGWPFDVQAANIDETRRNAEDAVSYVRRLAEEKASAIAGKISEGTVLGADTVVVIDREILGQPTDDEDARRMLSLLSGKWHDVLTGVALVCAGRSENALVAHEKTRVRFAEMSSAEIDWYLSTGEHRGKAGAYAIQGKAAVLIEEIEGDYFNIVGLPIRLVYELSKKLEL